MISLSIQHFRPRLYVVLMVMFLCMASLAGCTKTDRSLDIVQSAIDALDRQPGAWQTTLQGTIDELGKVGSATATQVLNQVKYVYTGAVGSTGAEARCSADFVGTRVKQQLQGIRHSLDAKSPAPVYVPVVCTTNPPDKVDAGKTQLVTYYGYDFLNFAQKYPFTAMLQYDGGQVIKADFGHVAVISNYALSVEFQQADYSGVDASRGPQLILEWGSDQVSLQDSPEGKSILPVMLPAVVQPIYDHEDFTVDVHGDSCVIGPCSWATINSIFSIAKDWTIDRSKGDAGHPGIQEIEVLDNQQSRDTLRGYNYGPTSDTAVNVTGQVRGSGGRGDGAQFHRTYRVYKWRMP